MSSPHGPQPDATLADHTLPSPDRGSRSLAQATRPAPTTVLPRLDPHGREVAAGHLDRVRYQAERILGAGSFGEVTLAVDNDIDRRVAIKRVLPEAVDDQAVARFVSEVQVVGRLEHPGIVPIHDVGLDETGYFFVMKYVEGETLEKVIAELRAKNPDYLARYTMEHRTQLFLQLARAVHFAHQRGIIHRDIKPANVMVGRYGEVMLMDWGLARRLDTPAREPEGIATGTPNYMAPEQARGLNQATDVRSDVYSLCALFYELLTTEHYLTPKRTIEELLVAVTVEEPLGPIQMHHRFGVPPELAWLVAPGLAKDPARRYPTVGALCERVQAAIEGRAPVECPCTGLKRADGAWRRFIDGHPIAAVVIAVLTAAFAVVGVVATALTIAGA